MAHERLGLGVTFVLLAASSYALMGVFVKLVSPFVSDQQIVFMRNALGLIITLPYIFLPKRKDLATKAPINHIVRALSALLTAYCLFYSIHHILLADAILLNNTMPLFVPFVMFFWKKEKIPKGLFLPLLISFGGIILILDPTKGMFHQIGALVALASGLFMSISTCSVRLLKNEPAYRMVFYTFLIGTFISMIPVFWAWSTPTPLHFLFLGLVAAFGMIYQILIILAYRHASPTKISPFIYFAVILSGVFDWLIWNQRPHLISFLGLILVIIGTIFCARVEAKKEMT